MNSPISINIPVRRMDFNIPDFVADYAEGNSWKTQFANAMSAIFPDGERFFIDSVRLFADRVQDPVLRGQISAFIGQEANHGKEHEAFNLALERLHGLPMKRLQRQVKAGLVLARWAFPKRSQLALTVAFEHFTAILAGHLLLHPEVMQTISSAYGDIMNWHIVEETEHKAVAFDVYQTVDGSYALRVAMMVLATVFFVGAAFGFQGQLLLHERKLTDWRAIPGFLSFLLYKPGLFTRILPEYLDFYKPSFHPWQHDNRALITARVAELTRYEVSKVRTA